MCSLPGTGPDPGGGADGEVEEGYYLLRQFVVSRKNKVVNRGDSFRNRRRIRESSINSSASSIRYQSAFRSLWNPPNRTLLPSQHKIQQKKRSTVEAEVAIS